MTRITRSDEDEASVPEIFPPITRIGERVLVGVCLLDTRC